MGERTPDPLMDAYFSARAGSESDAAAWKARVDADPSDAVARASWLGWNMQHQLQEFLAGRDFIECVLWMIRNEPASSLLQLVGSLASGRGGLETRKLLDRAWTDAVAAHPRDKRVLENAVNYFGLADPNKAHELLLAVREMAPNDASTEWRLASHWMLRAKRHRGHEDDYSFENDYDSDYARRALVHAERAVDLAEGGNFNEWYEVSRIEAAAAAGDWTRAVEVAQSTLKCVADGSAGRVTGNVPFHAHRILGHAALRRGEIGEARQHLIDSFSGGTSPQLGSFGPDWSLAREMLGRGERDCVLESIRRCRAIWPGHGDELDLWELQVQRGDPCAFERSGFVMRQVPKKSAAKPTPSSDDDSVDDRDPATRAYVSGLQAEDEQALVWAANVERDPEDVESRAAWLGWAAQMRLKGDVDSSAVRRHLEWLVQNKPEHPFSGHAANSFTHFGNDGLAKRIAELWMKQVARVDASPRILGNAASHFGTIDRPLALSLIARAAALEPREPEWPARAAFVHLTPKNMHRDTAGFEDRYDPDNCARALVESERAYEMSDKSRPDLSRLDTHMKAAAGAKQWNRAVEVAAEFLRAIPLARVPRLRKAVHEEHAHLIFGLAALRRGEREVARNEMRAALAARGPGPCGFFPPNSLLALELLERGEREAMLEFLECARDLVPDQAAQIDLWLQHVRAGRTPTFEFGWTYI